MFDHLKEDLRRLGSGREQLRGLLWSPGVWAVVGYRYRRWVYQHRLPFPLGFLFNLSASLCQAWTDITTNIQIPATAAVGPGLLIAHTGTIVLSARAVLGHHCTLTQCVTIGHAEGGGRTGAPVIGNRVYLGPNSALIGPIEVGDDALIGVGAIVTKSVPPRGVVAGNPAQLKSRKGAFELIRYPGMEQDAERVAALAAREAEAAGEAAASAGPTGG